MIKVYHGTNLSSAFDISIHGIDLNKSLPNLDFGKGFYTTDNKKKAIDRALKKTSDYNRRNHCSEDAYLVELLIDESMFQAFHTKFFKPREQQWFEFVINNRMDEDFLIKNDITNHNKDNKYDIVFGEIADGTIANVANRIKNSDLNINEVDYSLFIPKSGSYYENQYSFHTLKALTCIKSISCAIIKPYNKWKRRG